MAAKRCDGRLGHETPHARCGKCGALSYEGNEGDRCTAEVSTARARSRRLPMHGWAKVNRDGAERTICRKCGADAAETSGDFGCPERKS